MPRTKLVVALCGISVAGCLYRDVPEPRIVGGPITLEANLSYSTRAAGPKKREVKRAPARANVPGGWIPLAAIERDWTAIVIHHSATPTGNAEIFDQWHREWNHWDGVGYDFVIGNGSDSVDGLVEVTFRWEQQRVGAHCGGTPGNWANEEAVGICLVGDFNQDDPTAAQMRSLVKLARFLQDHCGIPGARVYGHGSTPGARVTECPGRRFPMRQLRAALRR
jgi:N-acetylmuramoyl-L-alanine amidase-like protein